MPLLKLETSVALTEEKKTALLPRLSKIVAEEIGKPETYVMLTIAGNGMMMSGTDEPAAFIEVRSIGGLTHDVNKAISNRVCELLEKELGISADRIYLNFAELTRVNWGWNRSTFG
jgi:phenylpyruvate tautomerase